MVYSPAMTNGIDHGLSLLGPEDPAPVAVVNPAGAASVLLICDHASNAVPRSLQGLGLTERDLHRHIAYDIGSAEVTRLLADALDAPGVLAGYSRLVIDCNRDLDHPDSIVRESDGTVIPGNADVSPAEARARADACFWPYHRRIAAHLARFAEHGVRPSIVAVHGFTPVLAGAERPWHVGVLWGEDGRIALPLIDRLRRHTDLVIGDNEPYSGRLQYGYSIASHADAARLPNVLIELREDIVAGEDERRRTAAILADALRPILFDPGRSGSQEG
jgi:predicted N-formylglutamate amidohydrolase